jgi:hypothetical protein
VLENSSEVVTPESSKNLKLEITQLEEQESHFFKVNRQNKPKNYVFDSQRSKKLNLSSIQNTSPLYIPSARRMTNKKISPKIEMINKLNLRTHNITELKDKPLGNLEKLFIPTWQPRLRNQSMI